MPFYFTFVKFNFILFEPRMGRHVLLVGKLLPAGPDRGRPRAPREAYPAFPGQPAARGLRTVGIIRKAMPSRVEASWEAPVSVASRDRDTGVRLSFRRPSRLLPGARRFRHFARFHRNLLQALDKPPASGPGRRL